MTTKGDPMLMATGAIEPELPPGSILHPEFHARLLADLTMICRTAKVPEPMIHKGMSAYCGPKEVEWMKNYFKHKKECAGVCFVGQFTRSIDTVMMAMTAAVLRNFLDARIITLSELLQDVDADDVPEPSIMLIPNFYVDMGAGKPLAGHQVSQVYDVLLRRVTSSQMTVLYVSSLEAMAAHYGAQFRAFIADHFHFIQEG